MCVHVRTSLCSCDLQGGTSATGSSFPSQLSAVFSCGFWKSRGAGGSTVLLGLVGPPNSYILSFHAFLFSRCAPRPVHALTQPWGR